MNFASLLCGLASAFTSVLGAAERAGNDTSPHPARFVETLRNGGKVTLVTMGTSLTGPRNKGIARYCFPR